MSGHDWTTFIIAIVLAIVAAVVSAGIAWDRAYTLGVLNERKRSNAREARLREEYDTQVKRLSMETQAQVKRLAENLEGDRP